MFSTGLVVLHGSFTSLSIDGSKQLFYLWSTAQRVYTRFFLYFVFFSISDFLSKNGHVRDCMWKSTFTL